MSTLQSGDILREKKMMMEQIGREGFRFDEIFTALTWVNNISHGIFEGM